MKIKLLPAQDFWSQVKAVEKGIINGQFYEPSEYMTAHEKAGVETRKHYLQNQIRLHFGLFNSKNQLVGWSAGMQTGPLEYFMLYSAVLPAYRRKGAYSSLLKKVLSETKKMGFQSISSAHYPTNSAILIAKMRMGFVISGIEISDPRGVLVKLIHYHHPLRSEVMKYRVGEIHPSAQLKKVLKLK